MSKMIMRKNFGNLRIGILGVVAILGACSNPKIAAPVEGLAKIDPLATPPADTGIKNYEQIYASMAAAMGVPTFNFGFTSDVNGTNFSNSVNEPACAANDFLINGLVPSAMANSTDANLQTRHMRCFFELQRASLPGSNDISSFSAANQSAIFKLAGAFCNATSRVPAWAAENYPGINFAQNYNQTLLNYDTRDALILHLIRKLWGSNLTLNPDEETARRRLHQLNDELIQGADLTRVETTRAVAVGLCMSILASAPTVVL